MEAGQVSREIHYCRCGQSIFHDMTECGDCVESIVGVIGIDPGPEKSARVLFDGLRVTVAQILPNDQLLESLGRGLHVRVPIYCEHIASYGMAVGASVFETCVWIGRFMQISQQAGSQFSRVFRRDIKLHLCNSPRAKDGNVRQALIDRLGPQGTKKAPGPTYGVKSHEWAALAVAVYGWDQIFGRQTTNGGPPA
jgi:hypothetical protein